MTVLRVAISIAWFSSLLWLTMMIVGFVIHTARSHHHPHRPAAPAKFKKLIIQITTIGDDIIDDTVGQLRTLLNGRDESLYEIWIVTEPTDPRSYPTVDRVLVVPPGFRTSLNTKFKSRALEYARLYRLGSGFTNYKVLYIDDDSNVTPDFVDECYKRSFDLMQGIVVISHPRGILAHLDAGMRVMSCLSLCSFFQEINHHLWTHGEGFCIDEKVDHAVSWNYPGWYADDLVYGAIATRKMGFRMQSTYARVETNSPIGVRQYIKQRRRWFWASAMSTYLLPLSTQIELWTFAVLGLVITPVALTGIILGELGIYHIPAYLAPASQILFITWLFSWAFSGYFSQRKFRGILTGVFSAIFAPTVAFSLGIVGILMGPVQTFEVMKRVEVKAS
jgi:hypothetical protein